MGKKIIGFIIVVIGAILLAGFVYFLFFNPEGFTLILDKFRQPDNTEAETGAGTETGDPGNSQPAVPKRIIIDNDVIEPVSGVDTVQAGIRETKNNLTRMAATFAERFGSYSNQSDFDNLNDLKMLMSRRMKEWADAYIRGERQKKPSNDLYYGITTKAIAEEIKEFDDHIGQAEVLVNTRRREATGSTGNVANAFSQDIEINFINESGAWKVDAASWLDR